MGNFALRAILSGRQREDVVHDIHEHLADVKDKVGWDGCSGWDGCRAGGRAPGGCEGQGGECSGLGWARADLAPDQPPLRMRMPSLQPACHPSSPPLAPPQVLAGLVPLNKYVITKQLTKNPSDYPDAKNQPHVQVALRRRAQGKQNGVMAVSGGARGGVGQPS